jgi:DNA-binding winged helix-turn-helix (wHTH) protein/TolB-like protein/tetratricopeptide (TPR) repeat protein
LVDSAEYRIGRFTLRPHRQLLQGGVPVSIGRKALDLLSVLAEANGALVTKDELMAAVWPKAIVEDNAIQVHVAALRKILGQDAELLSTAHGLGYRLAVSEETEARPAPTTAPIVEPPAPVEAEQNHRRSPQRALAVAVVAIVVLAASVYAWFRQDGGRAQAATPPTIAVLAFQPADNSEEARLFADGLARSVASSLSRYDVTVIAASSSLQLTPAQKPQARSLLGADFVVDGRVQSDHGKVTVSTQISDTHKNILIFSFDVQGDSSLSTALANQIATHLAFSLDPAKFLDDPTQKFTASDYALIARENEAIDHVDLPTNMRVSRQLAERFPDDGALQSSAGFAVIFSLRTLPQSQQAQFLQTARADIERGARLAPRSGSVYYAKSVLVKGPMSLVAQERLLRQSMQLSPSFAPTYNGLGENMQDVGRVDEGVALLQRSIQLDPLSELVTAGATQDYIRGGREAEAAASLSRLQSIWPNSAWIPLLTFRRAVYFGTVQDQQAVAKKLGVLPGIAAPGKPDGALMQRAVATHDKALIQKSISNCFETYPSGGDQQWGQVCLLVMVVTGQLDDAFRFAELGYPDTRRLYPPEDDRWQLAPPNCLDTGALFTPRMTPFRNDPRFWSVALRTGLVNYWQTTQQWPDFCRGQLDTCKARAAEVSRSDAGRKA